MYRLRITFVQRTNIDENTAYSYGGGGLAIHSIIFVSAWETNMNRLSHEHRTP